MATPLDKPSRSVTRVTNGVLGFSHGSDRNRQLVCSLQYGDTLVLKPKGRRKGVVTLLLVDLYTYGLKCQVNKVRLEKAREKLAKKRERDQARKSRRIIRGRINS